MAGSGHLPRKFSAERFGAAALAGLLVWLSAGRTDPSLADEPPLVFNEQRIPTRRQSGRWERSTVWAVLRNPAYKGAAGLRQDAKCAAAAHHPAATSARWHSGTRQCLS